MIGLFAGLGLAVALTTFVGPGAVARSAFTTAAWATENRQLARKSERVTRATAILFALEANLDFEKGGDVSRALARFYGGCRRQVIEASIGTDGSPFRAVAAELEEIASAWRQARAA